MSRDWNPILERAREVRTGKSRSYVEDAQDFAAALDELIVEHTSYCIAATTHAELLERFLRLERDHAQATAQLTAVQKRCTELLNENRKLRGVDEDDDVQVRGLDVAVDDEASPPKKPWVKPELRELAPDDPLVKKMQEQEQNEKRA